jgi:hypothetical protein
MPAHTSVRVSDFAPKARGAVCDLFCGKELVAEGSHVCKDSLIVNHDKRGKFVQDRVRMVEQMKEEQEKLREQALPKVKVKECWCMLEAEDRHVCCL